jgi:hypothetical protein
MATLQSILQSQASAPTQGVSIEGATTVGGPLFWLRWEGATDAGATVAVAAGGDMTFTTDGSTADTTVNATGSIDLSTPAAGVDTMGELMDVINQSANWAMVLLGARRASFTNNCILTVVAVDLSTAAKKATGHYFFQDPAVVDATSEYSIPWAISGFDPSSYNKLTAGDPTNPDLNCQSSLTWVLANTDWSASGYLALYSCSQEADGDAFHIIPTLADNTDTELGNHVTPIHRSRTGERLVVRVVNDASGVSAATILHASGYTTHTRGDIKPGYSLTNAAG